MSRPRLLPLISELYIVSNRAELVRFGDVLKPDQLDLIARAQRQLDTRGQIRLCILKARQIGVSTVIEAILFVLTILYPHFNAMVVSHENNSATRILNMTRVYWETFIFRKYQSERYNGRTHLAWDNHSDIHIATAKNVAAGRSMTIQALHASEVAFWPDPKTLMTGLNKAIPKAGLSMIALESTANGVGNLFHIECNKAMRGEGDYEFVFYPWWQNPEYTMSEMPETTRERYSLLGDLDEEEQLLVDLFNLSDERLLWRRWAIANECHGDVNEFHQEYPSTPHEAFISTGRNIFHLPALLAHYQPRRGLRGLLRKVKGRVKFFPDPQGWLTIFSYPSDDRDWGVYLVGADPTHAPGGDYACAQVLNRRTKEQVAVYRNNRIDPITFGKHLQLIGTYYNRALLAPEKTGPGYATIGCIVGDGYPNVYQSQRVDKMQGIPTTDLFGWATNVETKELAIAHLVKLLMEPLANVGGAEYGLVIHDEITLMELRDYIKTEKGLGYGNSDGSEYDDGVMAMAIASAVDAIEPKPGAYEMPDPGSQRARVAIPRIGTGPVLIASHDTITAPFDPPVAPEDFPEDFPEELKRPVWEAWGKPRDIERELE